MGGFIGLRLLAAHPERVVKLAIAGVGETYLQDRITSPEARAALADALLTPDKDSITDPRAKMFRAFADQPGKDRFALAACMRAMSPRLAPETLSQLQRPVLVVDGEQDETAGAARAVGRGICRWPRRDDSGPRSHVGGGRQAYPPGGDRFLPLTGEPDPGVQSFPSVRDAFACAACDPCLSVY